MELIFLPLERRTKHATENEAHAIARTNWDWTASRLYRELWSKIKLIWITTTVPSRIVGQYRESKSKILTHRYQLLQHWDQGSTQLELYNYCSPSTGSYSRTVGWGVNKEAGLDSFGEKMRKLKTRIVACWSFSPRFSNYFFDGIELND